MPSDTVPRKRLIWWVCGLLLCASTINYMDRQTLSVLGPRIKTEFKLSNQEFGNVEFAFGYAFAFGSLLFGIVSDRVNIRWLYPIALALWSLMGFLTGYVETYTGLILCRMFLGLFEAGHWPCALITTHRLLPPESRTFGNSVLQSGTAIGAIVTPLIVMAMVTNAVGSWRPAFQVIGATGTFWVIAWILSTNSADFAPLPRAEASADNSTADSETLLSVIFSQKFFVMVCVVISINACWHVLRVWTPMFLKSGRHFEERTMLWFMTFYYAMNDVGCLSAGLLSRKLHQRGFSVYASRVVVFGISASMVATGGLIPWLPSGPGLVIVLVLVAMGSLGLFPCYYSFSQELSTRHKGKVVGLMGTIAWLTSSGLHPLLGWWADKTESYDLGMALSCGLPLVALFALTMFWPEKKPDPEYNPAASLA